MYGAISYVLLQHDLRVSLAIFPAVAHLRINWSRSISRRHITDFNTREIMIEGVDISKVFTTRIQICRLGLPLGIEVCEVFEPFTV